MKQTTRGRITLRTADASEAKQLHALIQANLAEGHLLPRTLSELTVRAGRFVVAVKGRRIVGCAELAPLSPQVAEVRSLAVDGKARGSRVGKHFEGRLRALAAKHPMIREIRGAGLMWGLDLSRDAAAIVPAGLERGVVVNRTAETVVRLLPPLIITETEVDEALGRLDAALGAVGAVA